MPEQAAIMIGNLNPARGHTPAKRDTVLRVLTDLFIHNGDQQSPTERAMHDELMFNLLSEAGMVMRQEVAERLAGRANPPARVMKLLAVDDIAVSRQVLLHAACLDDAFLADVAGHAPIDHARAVAGRPQLGPATLEALLRRGDRDILLAVARNPAAEFSPETARRLAAAAQKDKELAGVLLQRPSLRSDVLIALFWRGNAEQRARMIEQLSENNNGLGSWQNQLPPLAAPILTGSLEDKASVHRGLVRMLMNRRMRDFQVFFAKVLGIRAELMEQVMADDQGEPFAVVCKAGGFVPEAFTTLLLLYNPVVGKSVNRVFALGQLYKTLPEALCWRMLQAWNAAISAEPGARAPTHRPFAARVERPARTGTAMPAQAGATSAVAQVAGKRSA